MMMKKLGTSLGDTIDLVPVGGYFGKGKRKEKFGAFLMASPKEWTSEKKELFCLCK